MTTIVRVGMAQMYVVGGDLEANLARAQSLIAQAAQEKADFIILPECCDLGWTDDSAGAQAGAIPGGNAYKALRRSAQKYSIYVAAGLTERAGGRVYNSAVCISPQGELLSLHRKINELDIAHYLYAIGDRLSVFETPFGTMGLDICADNFGGSLGIADTLCRMGARLILSPCAWAADVLDPAAFHYDLTGWIVPYTKIARHHQVAVIGVSNCGEMPTGPWAGKKAIGCSLAVGPEGEILAKLRTGWDETAEELRIVAVPVSQAMRAGTALPSLFAEENS